MGWFGGFTMGTSSRLPDDFEQVAVGEEVVALTANKIVRGSDFVPREAKSGLISVENGDVRFRLDGGDDPTTEDGHYLSSGDCLVLNGTQALQRFRAVKCSTGEGDARLTATYFY